MLRRQYNACMIRPEDLRPSREDMEVIGVFNPGVILHGNEVIILARIAEKLREQRWGYTPIPRWEEGVLNIDWYEEDEVEQIDPRWVRRRKDGIVLLTNTAHLRVLRSKDGRAIDSVDGPRFLPLSEYETYGVEDPRITRIGDTFYITYVSVSRHGACTSLATTRDFQSFERHGIIFPPENKDVVLFPEKLNDEYVCLHRPNPATAFSKPEIWIACSLDLVHWGRHRQLRSGGSTWEAGRTGAGAPPIRTSEGWLEIYHGNRTSEKKQVVGAYSGGALLLDPEHPGRILKQSDRAILEPEKPFETEGFVPNVVFPTGIIERDDIYQVYYGAADTYVAVVEFSQKELLGALK